MKKEQIQKFNDRFLGLAIVFLMLFWMSVITIGSIVTAHAHEWYDKECCDNRDCAQITKRTDQIINGIPGWQIETKFGTAWLPKNFMNNKSQMKIKPSRDENWHACILNDELSSGSLIRCIYVPFNS